MNQCGRCGSGIHFTECIDCDGVGYEEDIWACEECDGDGFVAFCISSQEWCEQNPLPGHENTPRNTVQGVPLWN
jgi:hypothetical protein